MTCVVCGQKAVAMGYHIEDIDQTPVPICEEMDSAHDDYRFEEEDSEGRPI